MKIAILGTSSSPILSSVLMALHRNKVNIDYIILDQQDYTEKQNVIWQERTAGRFPFVPLYEFEEYKIPTYFVKSHSSDVMLELIQSLNISLLVNGDTPRILPLKIVNAPAIGVLNVHPGVLPYYRGCTCVEWAIYNDDEIGNTAHLMNEKIDSGQIIKIETYRFSKSDRYVDIRTKVYQAGFNLLASVLKEMQEKGPPITTEIPQEGSKYYKVIDSEKMNGVMRKLKEGQYKYQF